MEETRIVLVRHGESRSQESRTVGGHTGCKGLSDRGRTQVEALRDRLARTGELSGAAALYSSVMARAVETAEILAPALDGLEVASECAFCESHPGPEADGLEVDEYERRWPPTGEWSPTTRRDPGGETYAEMRERVSGRLDELVERHRGETVVVAWRNDQPRLPHDVARVPDVRHDAGHAAGHGLGGDVGEALAESRCRRQEVEG